MDDCMAASIIDQMNDGKTPIAFDYETNCLKPEYPGAEIVCCSVCWGGKKTIAYPWSGEAVTATVELLASQHHKIACNLKFEHRWTQHLLKTRVKNWVWDTMIAAHVIDNRPGITSLKFQTYVNFGVVDYEEEVAPFFSSAPGGNSINNIFDILNKPGGKESLLTYCGFDSIYQYRLAMRQQELMKYDFLPF